MMNIFLTGELERIQKNPNRTVLLKDNKQTQK